MNARRLSRLLASATLAAALVWGGGASAQEPLGRDEMLGFLAQCLFTDEGGQPVLPAAGRRPCPVDQLQRLDSPARWRKHDYANRGDAGAEEGGYQVSDSVVDREGGRDVVIQTFDFGDADRTFRRYDRGNGDGGDYVALVDDAAYGVLTEDGGNGIQWFVGESCRTGEPDGRLKSWLFFRSDVRRGRWTEAMARLNIARSAEECPTRFNSAYTRYQRATLDVPFRITDRDGRTTTRRAPVDTIVSEHFGRDSIATADHLERFYFGRDLGKYRWERWEQRDRTLFPKAVKEAAGLKTSGRCAPLPFSTSPGEGYVMTDCRFWTNLVWEPRPWPVSQFGWPSVKPFGDAR